MKKIFLLFTISLTLISCIDLPNESKTEENIISEVKRLSKGNVEFYDFKKTNALEKKVSGIEVYGVEFEGKLKYLKDGFIWQKYGTGQLEFSDKKDRYHNKKVNKGETKVVIGSIIFIKKENGWEVKTHEGIDFSEKK